MVIIFRKLSILLLIFAVMVEGEAFARDKSKKHTRNKKWSPQIELEGKFGNKRNVALPKMLIPIKQDSTSMWFADVRMKHDNKDSQEYNIGTGYRKIINPNWIVGGYGFIDNMRSKKNNSFIQATIGAEALSKNWDIRTNIYIPKAKKKVAPGSGRLVINGSEIGMRGAFERALPGIDGEVGYKLPTSIADTRAYLGGFYFSAKRFGQIMGPKGRLELAFDENHLDFLRGGKRVTIGAELQHDDVRKNNGFAVLKVTLPLNQEEEEESLDPLEKRMTKFIERDVDVVTNAGGRLEPIQINGNDINQVINVIAGDDATTKIYYAGENTLVLLDGSGGTIDTNTTIFMRNGQSLIGKGSQVAIKGKRSGVTINHKFEGTKPTINDIGTGGNVLIMADNTYIKNVNFDNANLIAIASVSNNTTLEDINITNSAGDGIFFVGASNAILRNITMQNILANAIEFHGSSNISIFDSNFYNTGVNGMSINNTSNLTFERVNFVTVGFNAVLSDSNSNNIAMNNITVTGASDNGFQVQGSNITISNSTINNSNKGITITGSAQDITVSDTTINNSVDDGIIVDAGTNIDLENININNSGDDAISVNSATDLDISNVDISGAIGDAFDFSFATILGLDGEGNTATGSIGGFNCETTAATITGSLSVNGGNCP